MKTTLLFISLFLLQQFSFSQNLVPNPSFENFVSCPTATNQMTKAVGWSAYRGTTDYFNSCANAASLVSIPSNGAGYQYARTGNAYAGFAPFNMSGSSTRECLGTQLSQSLIIGRRYFVSFYVNRGANNAQAINIAINKIGARFSKIAFTGTNPVPIDNFAQVFTDSIITDTLNWVNISGAFIADSAYQYLSIGSFFRDSITSYIRYDSSAAIAYYYVDDIYVSDTILEDINNEYSFNLIKIYPNPATNHLSVTTNTNTPFEIILYDIASRKLIEEKFIKEVSLNIAHLAKGIYLYQITDERGIVTRGKVVKE